MLHISMQSHASRIMFSFLGSQDERHSLAHLPQAVMHRSSTFKT
jgi:hypothetical protein